MKLETLLFYSVSFVSFLNVRIIKNARRRVGDQHSPPVGNSTLSQGLKKIRQETHTLRH